MALSCEVEPAEKILSADESSRPQNDLVQTPPQPTNWKKWSLIISLVYANFWMAASISLQAPFFPREAELKGATPTQYGLVFGVYELVVIIMSPIYGKVIPKISPKFLGSAGVLIGGVACCVFGILDYVPAGRKYIASAFVVRIFEGLGSAALVTASFTIVAAVFPDSVATSFSLMETSFGLGIIVGPTVGGALYELGGFLLPFVVNGLFLLFGCILLYFLLPKLEDVNPQEGSRNFLKFLADGGIISSAFSIVSSMLFIGFNAATLEPHLRKFNLSPLIIGVIFITTAGIYAITTPIWGRICDKGTSPTLINIFGYILTCTGTLFIGPVPFIPFEATVGTVVGSLAVLGLGLSAKIVPSFVAALRSTSERGFPDNLATYGMVSAFVATCSSIGAFIGPSLGGFLLDTTGYKMGTFVMFLLDMFFFLILLGYAILRCMRQRSSPKDQCESIPILSNTPSNKSYS